MNENQKDSKNLLDIMGCPYDPAIFTGDPESDNRANTELYLRLVREGDARGFCPVLLDRDFRTFDYAQRYGFTGSREDYPRVTKRLIELVKDNCFSVWLGRLIYNYFLDCEDYEDMMGYDLSLLDPPDTVKYLKMYDTPAEVKPFILGEPKRFWTAPFPYQKQVFALVPVKRPWEVLAWIPIGSFNWCPDELHQIALAKGLYEQFGARIIRISSVSLDYYIPEPLTEKEDVERAAKILVAADSDVYQEIEAAVDLIRGSHVWGLWWD